MYFQDVIIKLDTFWARKGCVVTQPYDLEVGAGTFHHNTTLKALGPEPWNVAYVQPSRRPTDGRYGENPNRLQHYYQYQVILKPSPPDVQQQYLQSMKVLGVDPLEHDIRFVEDDWESPTLGASGLGWEVWLDGMEITQFTYFQQAHSLPLLQIPLGTASGQIANTPNISGSFGYADGTAGIQQIECVRTFETIFISRNDEIHGNHVA